MVTIDMNRPDNTTGVLQTSRSLIVRAGQNDPEAWERLVRLYSPLVYYWCRKSGLPEPDLHDVFQDVFHTLARNIGKFRTLENGTFRGWLRTLTRNKLIDHFRKSKREPRPIGGTEALNYLEQFPATVQQAATSDRNGAVPAESSRIETAINHSLLRRALENVRENFAEQTWKAFWLVVIEGRETKDVAKDLSMRPGTVRVAKSRVLKRLRLEIGDCLD